MKSSYAKVRVTSFR